MDLSSFSKKSNLLTLKNPVYNFEKMIGMIAVGTVITGLSYCLTRIKQISEKSYKNNFFLAIKGLYNNATLYNVISNETINNPDFISITKIIAAVSMLKFMHDQNNQINKLNETVKLTNDEFYSRKIQIDEFKEKFDKFKEEFDKFKEELNILQAFSI